MSLAEAASMAPSPAVALLYQTALASPVQSMAVIQAAAHPLLSSLRQQPVFDVQQSFQPEIKALQSMGLPAATLTGPYDAVLFNPCKDKVQSLGYMAQAFTLLNDGGTLRMACENQYGAKSYAAALQQLAGQSVGFSKSKCRYFEAKKNQKLDVTLQRVWLQAAQPQRVSSHGLWAQAGLFSWKQVDVGSALLLQHLPILHGKCLDLCAGYGLLSAFILANSDDIQCLHVLEAEGLALDCARKNLAAFPQVEYHHADASRDALPEHLDWLVCNPPFHRGQSRDIALGQVIVERGCAALKQGGEIWLVANRQLPYEMILHANLREVEQIAASDGFKVIRGKK